MWTFTRVSSTAIVLFLVALIVRMSALWQPEVQQDEMHWVSRTFTFRHMLHTTPNKATTHLAHPGIPAVIAMAAGQSLTEHSNAYFGLDSSSPWFMDRLEGSRLGAALASSLAIPLTFLVARFFLPAVWALLASLLLLFDPVHVGLSATAHLDTTQSTLVILCIGLYAIAIRKDSYAVKVLAGVVWGLCVATKPTAVALLLAFGVFQLGRIFISHIKHRPFNYFRELSGDISAVIAGHVIFASLYTRLWRHWGDYLARLHIENPLADVLFEFGKLFRRHTEISWFVVAAFALMSVVQLARSKSSLGKWVSYLTGCVTLTGAFLICCPAVIENLIRFWTWVAGLSGVKHQAFGHDFERSPGGYGILLFSRFPEVGLLGLLLCVGLVLSGIRASLLPREKLFITLSVLVAIAWFGLLSLSDKETWRYIIPILPSLYVLASVGYGIVARALQDNFVGLTWRWMTVPGAVLIAFNAFNFVSFAGHGEFYFNFISGGLSRAADRGMALGNAGYMEAFKFLIERAASHDKRLRVMVAGDAPMLKRVLGRQFPDSVQSLELGYFNPETAQYVLTPPRLEESVLGPAWSAVLSRAPVFDFRYKEISVLRVYEVPFRPLTKPLHYSARMLFSPTGSLEKQSGRSVLRCAVSAEQQTSAGSFLAYVRAVRMPRDNYRMRLEAWVPQQDSTKPENGESTVELQLDPACSRSYVFSEMPTEPGHWIDLECHNDRDRTVEPRIVLRGPGEVFIGAMKISRAH